MFFSRRALIADREHHHSHTIKSTNNQTIHQPVSSSDVSVVIQFEGRKFEIVWRRDIFEYKKVTWGILGSAAFKQYLESSAPNYRRLKVEELYDWKPLKGSEVIGVWDPILNVKHEVNEELTLSFLYQMSVLVHSLEPLHGGIYVHKDGTKKIVYKLLVEGPVRRLPNYLLQYLIQQNYLSCKDVCQFLSTCKRFQRILSADVVWDMLHCPEITENVWQGTGSTGSEAMIWDAIKLENGFPTLSWYRLRWLHHHSSKLRLFYGCLNNIHFAPSSSPSNTTSLWNRLLHSTGIATSPTTTSTQSFHGQNSYTIPVIGLSNEIISRNYMQRLHYIVPKSATQYHLKESATTVIPEGYVLGMESSPFDSRSRLESMYDPGTRIETNANGTIEYRRIGDKRLSFVQCYYDNLISQSHQHDCKEVWTSLTHQAMAYIIVLEYSPATHTTVYNTLKTIIVHGILKHSRDLPILVMLNILPITPATITTNNRAQQQQQRTENLLLFEPDSTSDAVVEVGVEEVVEAREAFDSSTELQNKLEEIATMMKILVPFHIPWYIQPFSIHPSTASAFSPSLSSSTSTTTTLSQGYLAGINWLIVTLQSLLIKE